MIVFCAADTKTRPVHRVIGSSAIVDEMIVEFTHDQEVSTASNLLCPFAIVVVQAVQLLSTVADAQVAFMLPGVAPTHKRVSIPLIVVVTFEGDKVRLTPSRCESHSYLTVQLKISSMTRCFLQLCCIPAFGGCLKWESLRGMAIDCSWQMLKSCMCCTAGLGAYLLGSGNRAGATGATGPQIAAWEVCLWSRAGCKGP